MPGTEYYPPPPSGASAVARTEDPISSPGAATSAADAGAGGGGEDAAIEGSTKGQEGPGAGSGALRWYPFGQGQRDCVGQALARLNYTAALATLLGRFSFALAPEVGGSSGWV